MHISQLRSSSQGTSAQHQLSADSPISDPNSNDGDAGTLDALFAQLDDLFTNGATDEKVHEYLRASLGLENECDNDSFCSAALRLNGSEHGATCMENHRINCASMNLAARIYAGQASGHAFLEDGRFNWDGFVGHLADRLLTTTKQVLVTMPFEGEEGISLQAVDQDRGAFGAEAVEAMKISNDAECLRGDGPNMFEQCPAEMLQYLFGFVRKSHDLVNAAMTNRSMYDTLREPVNAHQLVRQATQIESRSDVRALTGDDGDASIGNLESRHQAKVLSRMIGKLSDLPSGERRASFKEVLAATLGLPQRCQASLLIALTGKMTKLGSGARGAVFPELVKAASRLSDNTSFKVLAALARAIWMLPPYKLTTGFFLLLSAVNALRCRNEARPPALPLNELFTVVDRLPDNTRGDALVAFFELIDALPYEVRAAALAKLASDLQDHFQGVEYVIFIFLLTAIETLPLVHRSEPLTALSDWLRVIPEMEVASATASILRAVNELRNGTGVPPALFKALVMTLARQSQADKGTLFEWLVAVAGEVRRNDSGRLSALPLVRLGAALGMLSYEARRAGSKDYFTVFNALPDADREGLLIELATEIRDSWMDPLLLNAFLDAIRQLPAGCKAKPLSEVTSRIAWLSTTDTEIALATGCIVEFVEELLVGGDEVSAGLFASLGKLYWAQPESNKAVIFRWLVVVAAGFFRCDPNGRDISPAVLLGRMYDGLPDGVRADALTSLLAFTGRLPDGIHARLLIGISRGASRLLQGKDAQRAFLDMLKAIKSIAASDRASPLAALTRRIARLPAVQVADRTESILTIARHLREERQLPGDLLTALVELAFVQLDESRDDLFAWLKYVLRGIGVNAPEQLRAFPTRRLGVMLAFLPDGMRARALKDLLSLTDELPNEVRVRTLATVLYLPGLLSQGLNRQNMLNDILHVIDRLPPADRGEPLTALSREIRHLPPAERADATGKILQAVKALRQHAPVSNGLFSALIGLLAKHPEDSRPPTA